MDECTAWFVEILKKEFDVEVNVSMDGEEAVQLYKDELDPDVFPELEKLEADPLTIRTYSYKDHEENEWIAGVILDQLSQKWVYIVILKNGVVQFYKMVS
jgi:hypothetical protein